VGRILVGHQDREPLAQLHRREVQAVDLAGQHDDVLELLLPHLAAVHPAGEEHRLAGDVLQLDIDRVVLRAVGHGVVEEDLIGHGEVRHGGFT
jgi:hypothetical protein